MTRKKTRFFELLDLFQCITSWDNPSMTPNTVRLFAKKVPVMASLENYTNVIVA
jgi:hypothetical protein